MYPVLYSGTVVGTPVTILAYPTLLLLAVAACSGWFVLGSRRLGLEHGAALSLVAVAGTALLLGARAAAVLDTLHRSRSVDASDLSGFSLIGGLAAASL